MILDAFILAGFTVGALSLVAWTRDGLSLTDWLRWVTGRSAVMSEPESYLHALGRVVHPSGSDERE